MLLLGCGCAKVIKLLANTYGILALSLPILTDGKGYLLLQVFQSRLFSHLRNLTGISILPISQ